MIVIIRIIEFVFAKDEVFSQNQEIQNKFRQSAELPKVNDFNFLPILLELCNLDYKLQLCCLALKMHL